MLKCIYIAFCLIFYIVQAVSQTIEVKGTVIDSASSVPIPYASVGVKSLGIGTITNQQGNFRLRLPNSALGKKAEIQIIGYKIYSFDITSGNLSLLCKLPPTSTELSEIIVFPRDTLLNLLRLAYKKIPKNYSSSPVMYTGFFRESQKSDTIYLNFSEAIIDVFKNTYENNSNFGQVRLINSRKNVFPGIDTINNVRFYGGPHIAHTCDFVFKRSDYINPKHFKSYDYWLKDQKKVGNSKIYCIGFKHKNDSIIGTLYIDRKSLAYMGVDLIVNEIKQNFFTFINIKMLLKK